MEYPYVSLPIDSELKNEAGAKFSTEILDVGSSVELSFHDIEYAVPMKSKSNKYAVKKILRPMSGVIQPGEYS